MKKLILLYFILCLSALALYGQTNPNRDKPFSWDDATVYFAVTDRFNNGNTANDQSYGRGKNGNGTANAFDNVGGFHGSDIDLTKQSDL